MSGPCQISQQPELWVCQCKRFICCELFDRKSRLIRVERHGVSMRASAGDSAETRPHCQAHSTTLILQSLGGALKQAQVSTRIIRAATDVLLLNGPHQDVKAAERNNLPSSQWLHD